MIAGGRAWVTAPAADRRILVKCVFVEFIHHCIAHPILFWTRGAAWAIRFHDWTADVAWPGDTDAAESQ